MALQKKSIYQIFKNKDGVAATELALVAPIIIFLIMAASDFTTYLMAHQKISRAAYTMSNLMTQMKEGLTESQVSDLMGSLGEVSKPFDLRTQGRAIVTAIIGVGTDGSSPDSYEVAWKRCFGGGNLSFSSQFGQEGSKVSFVEIPQNMIVSTSQILVVTEVSYNFTPLIGLLSLDDTIEYTSYFRPRLGSIESIVGDGSPASTC